MRLVIDTNIIFSALLSSSPREIQILENQYYNTFYCQLSTIEIFKYKEKILSLSKLSEKEILSNYYEVLKHLQVLHEKDIPIEIRKRAERMCGDVDMLLPLNFACSPALSAQKIIKSSARIYCVGLLL